jgi:hypothetical protein
MLVVEEDWEGGVVTKERYFNLWTKLRECIIRSRSSLS